jgi:hypothetical protein
MIVVLPAGAYDALLTAPASDTMDFMQASSANRLVAAPVERHAPPCLIRHDWLTRKYADGRYWHGATTRESKDPLP